MSESDFDGTDSIGRKKPVKRPALNLQLRPRLEGETIEDWIKREADRHADLDPDCKKKKIDVKKINEKRLDAGRKYGAAKRELDGIKIAKKKDIAKLNRAWDRKIDSFRIRELKTLRDYSNSLAREKRTHLAKYNTLYNRCFTAVKRRVFQNMKSLCNIKHTWADPTTKRTIQNTDQRKNHKRNARKALEEMEENASA